MVKDLDPFFPHQDPDTLRFEVLGDTALGESSLSPFASAAVELGVERTVLARAEIVTEMERRMDPDFVTLTPTASQKKNLTGTEQHTGITDISDEELAAVWLQKVAAARTKRAAGMAIHLEFRPDRLTENNNEPLYEQHILLPKIPKERSEIKHVRFTV